VVPITKIKEGIRVIAFGFNNYSNKIHLVANELESQKDAQGKIINQDWSG
jgi:hypothetical protein